ncbi:MAG: ABC transporter substrate-binding protein [Betaproteobacteria bacterium]|nr:ABC transporter substrate-binding protein [Betaproteobacteria bacterium]
MTKRRTMLKGCAVLVLLVAALGAAAQTAAPLPRVVMILAGPQETAQRFKESLLEGLRHGGQIEGRTFVLHVRYASGEAARNAALVKEAVAERPDVLVVAGLTGARNARNATSTIPVVVATSSDLADAGIVASLARPGGNITGVSDLADEASVKRLELLKAALPKASRVALLNNPDFPATPKIETRVEAAAPALGVAVTRLHARDRASLFAAIDSLAQSRPDALLIGGDALFVVNSRELIERATALRVPVVHYWPGTAEQGATLSHQADIADNFRRAGGYVDKILRGAKPAELPIHQPTRYELVANTKAARDLGLTLPESFLVRADQVIR